LATFNQANPSAIFVIFITAVWPIIINTSVGVMRIPTDYENVARVYQVRGARYFFRILLPAAAPYYPIDEVKPGMVATGLTVWQGNKVEEFKVHILGVLRNVIGPRRDLILARPDRAEDRGAVWYLYERQNNPQAIAEALAPLLGGEFARAVERLLANVVGRQDLQCRVHEQAALAGGVLLAAPAAAIDSPS
jgi:hypothetical protein